MTFEGGRFVRADEVFGMPVDELGAITALQVIGTPPDDEEMLRFVFEDRYIDIRANENDSLDVWTERDVDPSLTNVEKFGRHGRSMAAISWLQDRPRPANI